MALFQALEQKILAVTLCCRNRNPADRRFNRFAKANVMDRRVGPVILHRLRRPEHSNEDCGDKSSAVQEKLSGALPRIGDVREETPINEH
jgi:hypothetical protein